jgi:putative ABC transport system ATP-binding protein
MMEKEKDSEKIIIHLSNVAKHYYMGDNVVKAVDGISIDIKRGDFVAVMGPSGSGKSTAMNLIGSLDMPTKGHIFLDKEDISSLDESELAQVRGKNIGFIFQQFNLIPTLTVKENVVLPMTLQGLSEEEREEKADKILHRLDLYDRKDHYPNQISGGQQQRVAIARALANDPEVILADEPTGNLDTKTGLKVMDFLTELNKEGRTVVVVTHSSELAKKYAHTVYWLKDGKIQKITKERKKN